MLLIVTNKCSMGCTHCLSDCTPEGKHITMEQFKENLDWALHFIKNQPILISGGEPFEHPQIKEILTYAVDKVNKLCYPNMGLAVITNGWELRKDQKLYNWYKEFTKGTTGKWIATQITNVPKYYPVKFTEKDLYWLGKLNRSFIATEEKEIHLYPQGRALNLDEPYRTMAPKCTNPKLIAAQLKMKALFDVNAKKLDIFSLTELMSKGGKFCNLRINIDGSLACGESALCPHVGTIYDTPEELFDKILNWNCIKCAKYINPDEIKLKMVD